MEELARELGCRDQSIPTSYSGLPLAAPHKAVGIWDVVKERFRKRLASWKRQYISKGGRLTLTRNTLSSLPIYFYLFSACQIRFVPDWRGSKESFFGEGAALRKSLILLDGPQCAQRRRKGVLG